MTIKTIPKSLARKGITSVKDNLQSGEWVSVSKAFCLVFRKELEARLIKKNKKTQTTII